MVHNGRPVVPDISGSSGHLMTNRDLNTVRWRVALAPALVVGFFVGILPLPAQEYGEVRWFDLLTEDAGVANEFYSELFGWEIERSPTGSWLALRNGMPIAGISQIDDSRPDVEESIWLAAIVVSDLRASVEAARRLGATIDQDITRVPGYGSYAVIIDPSSAPVILAVTERPLGGTEGAGAWVWAELWTDDVEASVEFYSEVVGYRRTDVDRPRGDYPVFFSGDQPRAGLVQIEDENIKPIWAPYLGVTDLAATLRRTVELGGNLLLEPSAELASFRVALLEDPTGGTFFVYELDEVAP